jgi:predicted permease
VAGDNRHSGALLVSGEIVMRRLRAFLLRVAVFLGKRRPDSELAAELEAHLAMQIEDNLRSGMTRGEARRQAFIKLGGIEQAKEIYHEQQSLPALETLLVDVRYALRMLRKNPGFATVATLTLALGIGANTAVFSVVHSVLLKGLPYPDPEHLVVLNEYALRNGEASVSWMDFLDWQTQCPAFEKMSVYRQRQFVLTGLDRPDLLRAGEVSFPFFSLLNARPIVGRTFTADEDRAGANRTAVLGYGFWRTHFGADRAIVDRTILLDGIPYTVIGVLPPEFRFFQATTDLYVPAGLKGDDPNWLNRGNHQGYRVLARLRQGVSLSGANSSLAAIMRRLEQQYPASNDGIRAKVVPLHDALFGKVQPSLFILLAASGCVLLIACANVASLTLARAAVRSREFAVRAAIGARRGRLLRQVLTECIVLSVIGGALGFACAKLAIPPLLHMAPTNIPRLDETGMDAGMFVFTFLVAVFTGMAFGIVPAIQSSRIDLTTPLRTASRSASGGRQRQRLRAGLLIAEISLAFVLVIASGLLTRSLFGALSVNPGFRVDHLLALDVKLPAIKYKTDAQQTMFLNQALGRLRSLPAVNSASAVFCPPLVSPCWDSVFLIGDRPVPPVAEEPRAAFNIAEPGYLETMQVPLLAGRNFTAADSRQAPGVVLVNETMAKRWWPHESAIGKKIMQGGKAVPPMEIVGVVGDLKEDGVDQPQWPEVFEAAAQNSMPSMTIVVRTALDPMAMAASAETAIHQVDKDQPLSHVQPMSVYMDGSLGGRKFETALLGIFGALALLLAAVGTYGLLAYMVTQRTYEIGIRMALGAPKRAVFVLVMTFGLELATCGIAIGLAASFAVTRVLQTLLFGVTPHDPLTFAAVTLLLTLVAFVACWIPAKRAIDVDPLVALRYE